MVNFLFCFLCSWISFSCLYLDNNWLILFLIVSLAKIVIILSLFVIMIIPIVIMAWLNNFKLFWWFYYAYTKDIVFVWLSTFICANNTAGVVNSFLELRFWFLFLLLLLLHDLPVTVWVADHLVLKTMVNSLNHQALSYQNCIYCPTFFIGWSFVVSI